MTDTIPDRYTIVSADGHAGGYGGSDRLSRRRLHEPGDSGYSQRAAAEQDQCA